MKNWKSTFIAVLVAETLAIAGFGTSMPVIPLFLQDLGIHDSQALKFWSGLIQSTAGITLALFAPLWGAIADSYGKRLMLPRSMYGGAAIILLMAFTTAPWQLLVLRGMQGCVTGTVAAATVLIAGIVPPAEIGFALGLPQTGVSVGNSLGPLLGGVVSDFLGRRAAFAATALLLLAAGIIVHRFVANDSHSAAEKKSLRDHLLPDFRPVLASPILISLMAVNFALQAAGSIPAPMLPLFIQEMTPDATLVGSTTGMVLGAGAAAAAVAAALVGRISSRFGYSRTLFVCLGGGALLSIPQAFARTPLELTVYRTASMLFLGGAFPAVSALIAVHTDKNRQGAAYGLNTAVSSVGFAVGPIIGSATAAVFDFRAVFIAGAAMLGGTVAGLRLAGPRLGRPAKK